MISLVPAQLQLSKYRLIEEIGHGGMATVYRAQDTRLEREVALKLIHRHLRENDEVETRFNSEARAIAKLRHPNIVEVYDVSDEDDAERFLIVELVRGITLRTLINQQGALPVELAAEIVLELAGALEHAHSQGVIHRDVKPENVLIESPKGTSDDSEELKRPRIKLTDFGIAKLLDAQGVTSTGQVLGSPAHMAPEQIEGRPIDVRADIFSLGVLFYECVVGSLPFAGKNPAQVLRNVLDGNFDPPERVRPEIGACWSQIIVKALSREPEGRYASVEEFAECVRAELSRVGFQEPRTDISRYLMNPGAYAEAFPARIAKGLSHSGNQARAERDRILATNQFSRALAYRPGDAELLRQVSSLRRGARVRTGVRQLALLALVGGVVAVVFWFWPIDKALLVDSSPEVVSQPKPEETAVVALPAETSQPNEVAAPQGLDVRVQNDAPEPMRDGPRRPRPTPEVVEVATRSVSIRVAGAVGGRVRIDGQEKPWLGVTHEIPVGEHLFEFVPPNENCCLSTSKRVTIRAGEGVQLVVGEIPFKDASLAVTAPESQGWTLACPTLFSERLNLPGQQSVTMSQVQVTGTCTLSNLSSSETRQKVVTLRAGNMTALSWP